MCAEKGRLNIGWGLLERLKWTCKVRNLIPTTIEVESSEIQAVIVVQ